MAASETTSKPPSERPIAARGFIPPGYHSPFGQRALSFSKELP
jgi:hypothetical protein